MVGTRRGWELLLHPDTGYMGVLQSSNDQAGHTSPSVRRRINAQTENSLPRAHSQRKSGPRIPTASGANETTCHPWRQRNGKVPLPKTGDPQGKFHAAPWEEPTSFKQKESWELTSPPTWSWLRKLRQRQNNLLKVWELVKDKSKCKSWVTSVKTN